MDDEKDPRRRAAEESAEEQAEIRLVREAMDQFLAAHPEIEIDEDMEPEEKREHLDLMANLFVTDLPTFDQMAAMVGHLSQFEQYYAPIMHKRLETMALKSQNLKRWRDVKGRTRK